MLVYFSDQYVQLTNYVIVMKSSVIKDISYLYLSTSLKLRLTYNLIFFLFWYILLMGINSQMKVSEYIHIFLNFLLCVFECLSVLQIAYL